jgi:hypothetical protein
MFIYKITIIPTSQVYIGLDTNPEYKKCRWKAHCRDANINSKRKIHRAMAQYGIENCSYEILESGFTDLGKLALAEIKYIKLYNSYRNGLNSSLGGDGIGKHDLFSLSKKEIELIKQKLGEHWKDYNRKKWDALSCEERKNETKHLHNEKVYSKKSSTLKEFYKNNPEIKKEKGLAIKEWQKNNKELQIQMNTKNGLLGALKTSKKVIVEKENGEEVTYLSRSEFQRQTGLWFSTLVEKTNKGLYYKGYRLKNK